MAHEANGYHVGQHSSRSSQMRERNTSAHNSECEVYPNTGPCRVPWKPLLVEMTKESPRGEEVAWK